jgi:RNA polymerase sigma-70 factor (ECF subfamily)
LQDADAQDVAQMVLLEFFRQIQRFQYDSSRRFRGWLRRLVHSVWCDFVEGRRDWDKAQGGSAVLHQLDSIAARDDLTEQIQKEHDRSILRLAMQRVEQRVEPKTWKAFWLLNIEELSGDDVVARLGMRLGSTYAASSKVRRLIRQEVRRMESDEA